MRSGFTYKKVNTMEDKTKNKSGCNLYSILDRMKSMTKTPEKVTAEIVTESVTKILAEELSEIKGLLKELVKMNQQKDEFSYMQKPLWTVDDIATYLKMTKQAVHNRVTCAPQFPPAYRADLKKGCLTPRWLPEEVQKWLKKHKDKN